MRNKEKITALNALMKHFKGEEQMNWEFKKLEKAQNKKSKNK